MELLCFILFLCILSSAHGQFPDERTTLLELKKSLSGPRGMLDSWTDGNHCTWRGVSCDTNLRVSRLEMGGNISLSPSCSSKSELSLHGFGISRNCSGVNGKLSGSLSAVVANLTQLKVLSLPFNELEGEIPFEVWGLENLEVLDLEGNKFTGDFSSYEFAGLKKLKVLNLAFNDIYGKFPRSLSSCTGLQILNLARNRINDVIPEFVSRFRKLRVVNLSFNRLIGRVPSSFCGDLEHLDLSANFLKGEIPHALGDCSNLRTLLLYSNELSGVIPDELGKLRNLEVLDVSRNSLGGPLPANLGNCTSLSVLILSTRFNSTHGKMSRRSFSDSNSFEGSFPDEITKLANLKLVWAPGGNFNGKFPSEFGDCKMLKMVNFARNDFTGEIFSTFNKCVHLLYLNISSNKLTGKLDEDLPISCMRTLDVSRNMLSGPIPNFTTVECRHKLSSAARNPFPPFDPSFSYLSFFQHKILSEYSPPFNNNTAHSLTVHDFSQNNFSGPLPVLPFAYADKTGYVFLSGSNNLTGSLDETLFPKRDDELALLAINASKNRISGLIPESLCAVKSLVMLDLSSNNLTGRVPENLYSLPKIEILLLNGNQLSPEPAKSHSVSLKRHMHVGCYAGPTEMLLVYNYLSGGNLEGLIRERVRRGFGWDALHRIAVQVGSAVWHVHRGGLVHRDIKPSNVVLDGEGNAYLSDFGLSTRAAVEKRGRVAGTYGYIAPEYAETGRVSREADVYSYGVVLLELMSEKRVLDPSFGGRTMGFDIVSWVVTMVGEGRVGAVFMRRLWDAGPREKLVKMLNVAVLCTSASAADRPSMRQVVEWLNQIEAQDSG
ncbi:LRR receptor-like serine/threonine-protein kinase RPK2 [Striga hermonthica]|uniref:non-specific serine/threonine protein kinase n=1 Tax=Striga hermonthica TaxID=68872 RepID=A0A9N7N2Y3_STRHE|nr:LRR receptor-like serine/threonine-protein kinase RPK2 [Striga hermonthica]